MIYAQRRSDGGVKAVSMAPLRVRPRSMGARDLSPPVHQYLGDLPDIAVDDSFRDVVRKLSV